MGVCRWAAASPWATEGYPPHAQLNRLTQFRDIVFLFTSGLWGLPKQTLPDTFEKVKGIKYTILNGRKENTKI